MAAKKAQASESCALNQLRTLSKVSLSPQALNFWANRSAANVSTMMKDTKMAACEVREWGQEMSGRREVRMRAHDENSSKNSMVPVPHSMTRQLPTPATH